MSYRNLILKAESFWSSVLLVMMFVVGNRKIVLKTITTRLICRDQMMTESEQIDRDAEREGSAIKRLNTYKLARPITQLITKGRPKPEKELDLLKLLNIVH